MSMGFHYLKNSKKVKDLRSRILFSAFTAGDLSNFYFQTIEFSLKNKSSFITLCVTSFNGDFSYISSTIFLGYLAVIFLAISTSAIVLRLNLCFSKYAVKMDRYTPGAL